MKPTLFSKVFLGLALVLALYYAFWLGMDVHAGDSKEAIADGILLAFWLFAFVLFGFMLSAERKMDRELEQSTKELDKAMDDLLGAIKEDADRKARVHKAMHAAMEMTGDRPPKPSEFKKVEAKFHEVSEGLYLRLTSVKGDKRPKAEVSDKPFAAEPKKAPVKKSVVKKTLSQVPKPAPKKGASNAKTSTRK